MALEGLNCFGPNYNDFRLTMQGRSSTTTTDWDLPATTNAGAHSPPGSSRWIEANDGGTVLTFDLTLVDSTFTLKDFVWYPLRAFRLQGTIGSGQSSKIYGWFRAGTDGIGAFWRYSSAGKINIGIGRFDTGAAAWGSSEFTHDSDLSLLLEYDSVASKARVYVNDTVEAETAAFIVPNTNGRIRLFQPEAGTNPLHYWSGFAHGQSDTETDRPKATTLFVHGLEGTSDGADSGPTTGYDDQDGGDNHDATYTDVALDGSDQVEVTNYWVGSGAETWVQTVDTDDPAETNQLIIGVHRSVARAEVGAKTLNTWSRIQDDGNTLDLANINITNTNWLSICIRHLLAPDGGAWTAYNDSDKLEFGVKGASTNTDKDDWAGMIFELAEVESEGAAAGQPTMRRWGGVPGMVPGGQRFGRSW